MSDLNNVQFVDQAQLKQVMLANADKADKRYVKKSEFNAADFVNKNEVGELASKDEVALEDLNEALVATINSKIDAADVYKKAEVDAAITSAVDGLGSLASKDDIGSEDLDESLAATIAGKADAANVYTSAEVDAAIDEAVGDLGAVASLDVISADYLSDAVKNRIEDTYTKAEVYTTNDVYTKDEVDSAIRNQVSSVYKPAGSATIDTLPEAEEAILGHVFNITEDGYTTDAFVEGEGKKIVAGTNVVVVVSDDTFKYDVFAGELDLSGYIKEEDINVATSAQIQTIIDSIYAGSDLNPAEEVVDMVLASNSSLSEISKAFNDPAVVEVNAKLNNDIEIPTRSDGRISTTMINNGQTVNIDMNGKTINCDAYAVYVQPGGTVNFTGEGTILTRNLNTYGAIQNNGGTVNIGPGIVIDTTQAEVPEGGHNWLYGIVSKDGVINVEGKIHTAEASCLAVTNGTMTGVGAQFVVEGDAVLKSDESAAIYLADNKGVLVKDNAEVGPIVMRMGDLTVQDNAKVVNDLTFQDDIPTFLVTYNGPACLPPAILLCAGCYKASGEGSNDANIVIKDNATVSSTNGEAVSVWRFDSLYDQNVTVNIEDSSKLSAKEGSDAFKVYEYAELAEIATAGGKTMKPNNATSYIKATVDGEVVYDSTEPEQTEP